MSESVGLVEKGNEINNGDLILIAKRKECIGCHFEKLPLQIMNIDVESALSTAKWGRLPYVWRPPIPVTETMIDLR